MQWNPYQWLEKLSPLSHSEDLPLLCRPWGRIEALAIPGNIQSAEVDQTFLQLGAIGCPTSTQSGSIHLLHLYVLEGQGYSLYKNMLCILHMLLYIIFYQYFRYGMYKSKKHLYIVYIYYDIQIYLRPYINSILKHERHEKTWKSAQFSSSPRPLLNLYDAPVDWTLASSHLVILHLRFQHKVTRYASDLFQQALHRVGIHRRHQNLRHLLWHYGQFYLLSYDYIWVIWVQMQTRQPCRN